MARTLNLNGDGEGAIKYCLKHLVVKDLDLDNKELVHKWKASHMEWLLKNNLLEECDTIALESPHTLKTTRSGKRGKLVAAFVQGEYVGSLSAAPLPLEPEVALEVGKGDGVGVAKATSSWELCKLVVASSFRGNGLGKYLLEYMIDYIVKEEIDSDSGGWGSTKEKEKGNVVIQLDTNSVLVTAVNLYKKYGFVVQDGVSNYETADLFLKRVICLDAYEPYHITHRE